MIQVIQYPLLEKGMTIGVTAPSSGVEKPLHHLLEQAVNRLESKGFRVVCGQTVWTQNKAKSAPADILRIIVNWMYTKKFRRNLASLLFTI